MTEIHWPNQRKIFDGQFVAIPIPINPIEIFITQAQVQILANQKTFMCPNDEVSQKLIKTYIKCYQGISCINPIIQFPHKPSARH